MIRTKLLSWISIVVYTFTFFLTSFAMWVPPAQADCFLIFFCSNTRSSFKSKGGVRRGPCAESNLVALAPPGKLESTVEGYPTFWFYVPTHKPLAPSETTAAFAKFVLLNENNRLVQGPVYAKLPQLSSDSQLSQKRSQTSGMLAGLTLPSNGKALEVGKQYSWYFSVICDFQKPSRNPEVTGQIQRVAPGPLPLPPEPAYFVHDNTYSGQNGTAENTVWYDTWNQLIKQRKTDPSALDALLNELEIHPAAIVELQAIDRPPENCDFISNATD